MAQKKNEQKKPAVKSACGSSAAGGTGGSQKSKSGGAVNARSQSAARPAGANTRGQKVGQTAGVSPQRQRSERTPQAPAPEKKNGLFKFRRYKKVEGGKKKKAKHPKLIVEQNNNTVGFMGLTESPKRGHHKNIELEDNPEKGNTDKAYVRKEIRYADLGEFGEILKNYNLSERDKEKIIEYLEKLKKK